MKKGEDTGRNLAHMISSLPVTRREFLKRMGIPGGGVVVYISVGDPSALAQPSRSGALFAGARKRGPLLCSVYAKLKRR